MHIVLVVVFPTCGVFSFLLQYGILLLMRSSNRGLE
jgi:hypothetical protein